MSKIRRKTLDQPRHVEKALVKKMSMLKSNYVEAGREQPGYKILFLHQSYLKKPTLSHLSLIKNEKNNFLLSKTLKNTKSAQLCESDIRL